MALALTKAWEIVEPRIKFREQDITLTREEATELADRLQAVRDALIAHGHASLPIVPPEDVIAFLRGGGFSVVVVG
jgi:hypothetical protein